MADQGRCDNCGAHEAADQRIYADDVEPGDFIMWAGRVAEVVEVRPSPAASTYSRSGRYLLLDVGGDDQLHRCQYFDNEVVTLRSRPMPAGPQSSNGEQS